MNSPQNEVRLERSLRAQIKAPRLDGRFDAAVWSRIDTEKRAMATAAMPRRAPRWLFASNLIGLAVTVVLVAFFTWRALNGVNLSVEEAVELPQVSAATYATISQYAGWVIAAVVLVFAAMFTPSGRRALRELI
jgi:hypothetical protein